jgi:hypothetical protein
MNSTHNVTAVDPVRAGLINFYVSLGAVLASLSLTSFILIIVFRNFEPIKGRRTFAAVATLTLFILETERVVCNEIWFDTRWAPLRGAIDLILLGTSLKAFSNF